MPALRKRQEEPQPEVAEFTVVTGLSGAGRTEAGNALEDLGYFVIDNLPPVLIGKVIELSISGGQDTHRIAFVLDVRSGLMEQFTGALRDLARRGVEYRILFLTASDEVLIRRYEDKRRKHPLADRVVDGIAKERALLAPLREAADLVIDTSNLSVTQLRDRIALNFSSQSREERMKTMVVSFGFKHGLPLDADIVLDVRFLPNPHWVDELRPLPGTDARIREYVLGRGQTADFLERLAGMLDVLVPGFLDEGKRYLTIAVGCTGGRHRSVVVADEVATMLRARGVPADVRHRDVERE